MQALFECEAHPRDMKKIFDYRMGESGKKITDREFAEKLFFGVIEYMNEIKKIITVYAPEWPIEKIDPVERAILYVGVYELVYTDDAPAAVVINEAIEVAKTFADEHSNKFINGVLNSVAKNEKKQK